MLKFTHRWLGLALCLCIFTMSVTGVLLVWKKEYLWLSFESARQALVESPELQARLIETIIAQYQPGEVLSIRLNAEELSINKVFLTERRYAWHDQFGNHIQQWQGNERMEDFLLDLHHQFLLGNTIGLNLAGMSGLLLLPLMVLGLWLWWPHRRTYRLGLLPRGLDRSNMIRSHSNLGVTAIVPVLVIAISGVVLVYPDESRKILLSPFVTGSDVMQQTDDFSGKQHGTWLRVLERTNLQYPQSTVRWVSPASDSYPYRTVGVQQRSGWNSSGQTMVYIDAASGVMTGNSNALLNPLAKRIYNFSYPLHTGKLGLWYRLLLSLLGTILCAIAVFGGISFLTKKPRKLR